MENRVLYAFLTFLSFGIVFLGISTVKWDSACRKNGYTDMTDWKKNNYDKEMAVTLAEAFFQPTEKWVCRNVTYNYPTHEWIVIFVSEDSEFKVMVRRDKGTYRGY